MTRCMTLKPGETAVVPVSRMLLLDGLGSAPLSGIRLGKREAQAALGAADGSYLRAGRPDHGWGLRRQAPGRRQPAIFHHSMNEPPWALNARQRSVFHDLTNEGEHWRRNAARRRTNARTYSARQEPGLNSVAFKKIIISYK